MNMNVKVAALAGGVGGAKLADGLAQLLDPNHLTLIVNVGDDFEHLGLYICPDLDTVCYTLAGVANPETGWGRSAETWNALDTVEKLGGESWFKLGDHDLGLHLVRSQWLREGITLSQVTRDICARIGVHHSIIPVSDQRICTLVHTDVGILSFQEYFVRLKCEPNVNGFVFQNVENTFPAPGVLDAVDAADLLIICPSNPWVSIDPILAVPELRDAVSRKPVIAVSPIIAGEALKGPAAKMFQEMGISPSAMAVADHYDDLLAGFVFDEQDEENMTGTNQTSMKMIALQTIMVTKEDRRSLAKQVLEWGIENFMQH